MKNTHENIGNGIKIYMLIIVGLILLIISCQTILEPLTAFKRIIGISGQIALYIGFIYLLTRPFTFLSKHEEYAEYNYIPAKNPGALIMIQSVGAIGLCALLIILVKATTGFMFF